MKGFDMHWFIQIYKLQKCMNGTSAVMESKVPSFFLLYW